MTAGETAEAGRKKYLKYFIAPLIVGLILIFVEVYVNREKPDVRFSLSGGLPEELLGETATENIQLLEIRNTGKEEAHRLRIKINIPLTSYKLKKFSEGDRVEEFPSTNGLEIIYPNLPPQGIIKVILQSKKTIETPDIEVSHSKGKGEEAFTGRTSFQRNYILISFMLIYGLVIIVWLRISAIEHFESKSDYSPNEILSRRKPIYINEKRWNSIRVKALDNKIKDKYGDDRYSSIEKTESYKLLCLSEKIDYVTEEEWLSLQHKAIEKLTNILVTRMNITWSHTEILKLLSITKPSLFPEKEWAELQNKMKDRYLKQLSESLADSYAPLDFFKKQDLHVLSDDQINKLEKLAYNLEMHKLPRFLNYVKAKNFLEDKKPEWMNKDDYKVMREEAEALVKANTLSLLLWNIIYGKTLPEVKPEIFTEKEWADVLNIAKQIKKMNEDYKKAIEERASVSYEKAEIEKLKAKIENQLNIIHNVLSDPKSIDRIEDYSDVFAPGNFENLKKISMLLSKKQENV